MEEVKKEGEVRDHSKMEGCREMDTARN